MRVPFRIEGFYKILENLVGSNALIQHLLEPYPEPDEREWEESPYFIDGGLSIGCKSRYAPWLPKTDIWSI